VLYLKDIPLRGKGSDRGEGREGERRGGTEARDGP